jgi:hypothetical protein
MGVVVDICYPRAQEAEAGGTRFLGKPELHGGIPCLKETKQIPTVAVSLAPSCFQVWVFHYGEYNWISHLLFSLLLVSGQSSF